MASVCSSYKIIDRIYTNSRIYVQHVVNSAGCDSTITLNLTVRNTSSSIFATSCDSYVFNNTSYTGSGVYIQHLTNVAGCDSLITLHLTINNSSSSHDIVSTC